MVSTQRMIKACAGAFLIASFSSAVTAQGVAFYILDEIPPGIMVDLTGLPTGAAIAPDDPAFLAAGIASMTVTRDPSTNVEFYDGGEFGAGRALFGTEEGELIALDEGARPDFGSPTFTIQLAAPVQSFGLRIADTSERYATPRIELFLEGESLGSYLIDGEYDAATQFGFFTQNSFDQIVIEGDTVGSGFGFDGVGITDITVGVAIETQTEDQQPSEPPSQ